MKLSLRPHQSQALNVMKEKDCGQIIVPTGGGKTMIMIQDCINDSNSELTVIVAPRILLAQQLCDDFIQLMGDKVSPNLNMFHTHSGRTKHLSSTKPEEIKAWVDNTPNRKLLFTTYHSLSKVVDSGINIDTIYYDEAHNGTAKSFNISVSACKQIASRSYYFTATPKISYKHDRGMNNVNIWGEILLDVDARDLIKCGSIIPPNVQSFPIDTHFSKYNAHAHHSLTVKDFAKSINNYDGAKVLVSVPSSRILNKMLGHTKLLSQLKDMGFDVMHITSKFGAYVNQTKVNRTTFFNTLKEWGCQTARKFIIFHYSILSEGINVNT